MNRADILRMAREAGAVKHEHHEWWNFMEGELERFAELVEQRAAKAEREACAALAEACDDADSAARFIRARSNAKVSGAGAASAGLPGYADGGNGERK